MAKKKKFKYRNLKSRIVLEFGSQANFADYLNVSDQNISQYLTGKTMFSQQTIAEWCDILGIELSQVGKYFFQ